MPRVLVVDDDKALRTVIRAMLASAGYEVEDAADGNAALKLFRTRPADLVLCDLFMPDSDGLEVLRKLRAEFGGVRMLAMSGGGFGGTIDLLAAAMHLGAAGILPKPFTQLELLQGVKRALAN